MILSVAVDRGWNPGVVAVLAGFPLTYLSVLLPQVMLPWKMMDSKKVSNLLKYRLSYIAVALTALLIAILYYLLANII